MTQSIEEVSMEQTTGMKRAKVIAIFIAAMAFAVVLGTQAGKMYANWDNQRKLAQTTRVVVDLMETIDIGDTLPDHVFEDLERNPVRLSDLIKGRTLVTFISPNCPSCEFQIEDFSRALNTDQQKNGYIFISPHNPRYLEELQDKYNLEAPILYDHRSKYWSMLSINTTPFNVQIGQDMILEEIFAGPLSEDEYLQIQNSR